MSSDARPKHLRSRCQPIQSIRWRDRCRYLKQMTGYSGMSIIEVDMQIGDEAAKFAVCGFGRGYLSEDFADVVCEMGFGDVPPFSLSWSQGVRLVGRYSHAGTSE